MTRRHDPFKALADGTRRSILTLLQRRGACSAGEIADAFSRMSRPAVSRHLRVLRQAGLVTAKGVGGGGAKHRAAARAEETSVTSRRIEGRAVGAERIHLCSGREPRPPEDEGL